MPKIFASIMVPSIGITVTFICLTMLLSEVASSLHSSKDITFLEGSSFNRVKRDSEAEGAKSPVQDAGSGNHAAMVENTDTKLDAEKSGFLPNCSLSSSSNTTECKNNGYVNSLIKQMSENKGMLWRTLCVSLGVTGIVIVYFVVRAIR